MARLQHTRYRLLNNSLQRTRHPAKNMRDERCGAICLQGCIMGMPGFPEMDRTPAPQLEAVRRN